jgi:hypothetical protein
VEYSKNKFACEVMDGQVVDDRYRVLDDVIFYKDQIYLVPESTLKGKILKVCHDSPTTGHQGYFKRYRQIRERFSWKGFKDDVLKHIRECPTSPIRHTPRGCFSLYPFQSRNGREFLWISLQAFLECRAGIVYFMVVDRLTKFAHFFAIPMDYKAIQVA